MEIITSHINADFDALSSMVAAKKLYPSALLVFPGSQEEKVRDFMEVFRPVEIRRIRDIDLSDVKRLIVVDTKQPGRIGPLAEVLKNPGIRVHVYDHHPFEEGDLRGEREKIEEVGATATLFVELLREKKLPPTPMEATILALGIYEETGCLLFPSTTERDVLAVSYLLKKGANLNIVSSYMRMELTREELELLNELVKSSADIVLRGVRVFLTRASRETYVGDAAHLAHRLMEMEDIDAVIVILDMEGKILVIARSRVPELNVAELLKEFGGGGHPTAASATMKEASAEVIAERVSALLPKYVKPGKVASDIMTTPVISTQWSQPVKEVEETLTRYGVNVLPVLRDGRYLGLISRETVEKALYHGFRKHKASEFATMDALTVEPETPIREIETLMIEQNQRFMPVLSEGKIVGAITRTDLLRVLYEEFLRKRHLEKEDMVERISPGRNLASWLRERFPDQVCEILRLSGQIAEDLGYGAYLVGGSVRDLLLGHENLDIDIVIEGDGIHFARALSEKLGTNLKYHERFGTAHITANGLDFDIATARTEYYESPAALPKVETSSIKKDLYRRDFTINTLAVKLNPHEFGLLIDFFGGQRDIRERTIRVLHNLSYVEDPTRAFRAVRFAERFGFKLSRHTENLIKSAIQMHLFEKLSGHRLYEELILAFKETNPVKTLKRLSGYGLLKEIHRSLIFDDTLEAALSALSETLAWYHLLFLEEKADTAELYLMALLSHLGDGQRAEALTRLGAPPGTIAKITAGMNRAAEIGKRLPVGDPAELYYALHGLPLETVLFAMASMPTERGKKEISHFLLELKSERPVLTGKDLKKMGIPEGPRYAQILKALLEERLRGRFRTSEEEKAYVLRHFVQKLPEG